MVKTFMGGESKEKRSSEFGVCGRGPGTEVPRTKCSCRGLSPQFSSMYIGSSVCLAVHLCVLIWCLWRGAGY